MKIQQIEWTSRGGWKPEPPGGLEGAQLVLAFGSAEIMKDGDLLCSLREAYPEAYVTGCSTAGEIRDVFVSDGSLVVTAVQFERATVVGTHIDLDSTRDSRAAGTQLAQSLDKEGLVHAFVLSAGLGVNGSELVRGIGENLPPGVTLTGGLSADGSRFQETFVAANARPRPDVVSLLGFYGDSLRVGYASLGGWDPFGPERVVTSSSGNIVHTLDGESALGLYRRLLGEHAAGLPATGLLFPLCVRPSDGDEWIVRTILSVNEESQSLTFAGDVPEGAQARLMKANFDRLVEGASGAATTTRTALGGAPAELAILISCFGRKMVLKQRVEEEVEAVRDVLGTRAVLTGFYSYGEISPFAPLARCELHNQTMTITTLAES